MPSSIRMSRIGAGFFRFTNAQPSTVRAEPKEVGSALKPAVETARWERQRPSRFSLSHVCQLRFAQRQRYPSSARRPSAHRYNSNRHAPSTTLSVPLGIHAVPARF
jgi:hypothetical protein